MNESDILIKTLCGYTNIPSFAFKSFIIVIHPFRMGLSLAVLVNVNKLYKKSAANLDIVIKTRKCKAEHKYQAKNIGHK